MRIITCNYIKRDIAIIEALMGRPWILNGFCGMDDDVLVCLDEHLSHAQQYNAVEYLHRQQAENEGIDDKYESIVWHP